MRTWKTIPCLAYSLTEECNLKCDYCPPVGDSILPYETSFLYSSDVCLSKESALLTLKSAAELGVITFRLTGGEPLLEFAKLRYLVLGMHDLPNYSDLRVRLNTNGVLLKRYAKDLVPLELQCVKVGLDTLDPVKSREITGRDGLHDAIEGIKAVLRLCLPVELNMVWMKRTKDDFWPILEFCIDNKIPLLKVLDLNLLMDEDYWVENYEDAIQLRRELAHKYGAPQEVVLTHRRGSPMLQFTVNEDTSVLVKDLNLGTTYSSHLCPSCHLFPCQNGVLNITLSSNGWITPCRYRPDLAVDLRGLLSQSSSAQCQTEVAREVMKRMLAPFESVFLRQAWNSNEYIHRRRSRD